VEQRSFGMNFSEITTFVNSWRGYLVGHRQSWYPHQRSQLLGFRQGLVIAAPLSQIFQFRRVMILLQSVFKVGSQLWSWGMLPLPTGRKLLPEDFDPQKYHWGQSYSVWHSGDFSNHVQVLRFRQFCRRRKKTVRRTKLEHKAIGISPARLKKLRKIRQLKRRWRRLRRQGELPVRCYRQTTNMHYKGFLNALFIAPRIHISNAKLYAKQSLPRVSLPVFPRFNRSIRWKISRAPSRYLSQFFRSYRSLISYRKRRFTIARSYLSRWVRWCPPKRLVSNYSGRFAFVNGRYLRRWVSFNFKILGYLNTNLKNTLNGSNKVGLNRIRRNIWLSGFTRRFRSLRRLVPRRRSTKIRTFKWQGYRSQPCVLPGVTSAGGLTYRQQAFLTETKAISVPFVWFCGSEVKPNFTPWSVLWNQDKEHASSILMFFDEVWFHTQQLLLVHMLCKRISYL
jgi:hypothetical protein